MAQRFSDPRQQSWRSSREMNEWRSPPYDENRYQREWESKLGRYRSEEDDYRSWQNSNRRAASRAEEDDEQWRSWKDDRAAFDSSGALELNQGSDDLFRAGGFSGYGNRGLVPGQVSSSMQLGYESGWNQTVSPFREDPGRLYTPRTSFRGRGPKGFERSDERLQEVICEHLMEDPRIDASDVAVQVRNKEVTLTGTVNSRHDKFCIEELVDNCYGVKDINNQLRIQRGGMEASS